MTGSDDGPAWPLRLGRHVRARPRLGAALVAGLALLLVGTVVTITQADRTGRTAVPGQVGLPSPADAGTGRPSTTGGGEGAGTGGIPGGGPSTAPGTRPGAPSTPGAGRAAGGDAPVVRRPAVRCAPSGTPKAGPLPSPDENNGRRWVTLSRLTGNCDASSPPFTLQRVDTRLAWRSDADAFAVFVVDAVQGREATAGFADAQCAGSCSQTQPIVLAAGSYTLEVQAGDAPWEVEIQEYR